MSSKPYRNVMFLIADDWSPIAGCYGNEIIQTPRIDAFAKSAATFDWAFCTSPSCAASRACILTGLHSHTHGQYGHSHGIHGFRTHDHVQTVSKVLGEAGYATGLIGKKHVAPDSVHPFAYEPEVDMRSVYEMADCARTFFAENQDRPFYLHVGFADPHRSPNGFGNEKAYRDVKEVRYRPEDVVVPDFLPDLPAVREDLADYYQAISRFDCGCGLLLDALQESGRAEETLVIVTTDHGMPFPGAKASFFESGHHCPFLLRAPGASLADSRNQALINWTNIAPTFYDWCGVTPPPNLPAQSLLPIVGTPEPEGWDATFTSHSFHEVTDYNPYRVLRERQYKYAQHLAHEMTLLFPTDLFRSPTWQAVLETESETMGKRRTHDVIHRAPEELYDLIADPMETENLIDLPEHAERVVRMRKTLYDFRVATADPWLEVDFQENRPGVPFIAQK